MLKISAAKRNCNIVGSFFCSKANGRSLRGSDKMGNNEIVVFLWRHLAVCRLVEARIRLTREDRGQRRRPRVKRCSVQRIVGGSRAPVGLLDYAIGSGLLP